MSLPASHTQLDQNITSGIGAVRFTIFGTFEFQEPSEIFQKFFQLSPDQTNVNKMSGEFDLLKSTPTHSYQIKKVGEKTDFMLNASSRIHFGADNEIQAESGLPLIPAELDIETSFFDPARNFLREYGQGITRIAVSHTHVIRSAKGRATDALKKILPGIVVPAGSEDFLYRLNLPVESIFENISVKINRLAQWTATDLQIELSIPQGGPRLVEIGSGASVTTDVNTAASFSLLKIDLQSKIAILDKMINYSNSIIQRGEII